MEIRVARVVRVAAVVKVIFSDTGGYGNTGSKGSQSSSSSQTHILTYRGRDAGTRKGPGGQTLLKGTDKISIMLKSIPWNLEGQLHSSCAKFLPIIFLRLFSSYAFFTRTYTHVKL